MTVPAIKHFSKLHSQSSAAAAEPTIKCLMFLSKALATGIPLPEILQAILDSQPVNQAEG